MNGDRAMSSRQRSWQMTLLPLSLILIGMSLLVLALVSTNLRDADSAAAGPVYSVAEVQARLERDPAAWVGRSVLVRGLAGHCIDWVGQKGSTCVQWSSELYDTDAAGSAAHVQLVRQPPAKWLAFLRRVSFIGRLAPAAPVVYWGTVAVYRVQLRTVPCAAHNGSGCYAATVLEAWG